MSHETAQLNNYLILGALLFGIGMIGFLSRRNMIVMFLAVEIMLQGVSISLVGWGRFHNDFGGQMLVLFIMAMAACEAAITLALVLVLFERHGKLDIINWQRLRESNQPAFHDEPLPPAPPKIAESMPHLPIAGVQPEIPIEETDFRPSV